MRWMLQIYYRLNDGAETYLGEVYAERESDLTRILEALSDRYVGRVYWQRQEWELVGEEPEDDPDLD